MPENTHPDKVDQIRALRAQGYTYDYISSLTGVSSKTCSLIVRGLRWPQDEVDKERLRLAKIKAAWENAKQAVEFRDTLGRPLESEILNEHNPDEELDQDQDISLAPLDISEDDEDEDEDEDEALSSSPTPMVIVSAHNRIQAQLNRLLRANNKETSDAAKADNLLGIQALDQKRISLVNKWREYGYRDVYGPINLIRKASDLIALDHDPLSKWNKE